MLKYNNVNVLFILIVLICSAFIYTNHLPWWVLVFIVLLYVSLLVLGSVFIQFNFYTKSIIKLQDKKSILLTFDDGPDKKITPKILELLEQYQAKAVFFVIGQQIEKNADLVKDIHQKGHLIGNHSFSHSNRFSVFSVDKMLGEVEETNDLIERTIGEKPIYFRPPFGVTNPLIHRLIKRSGMKSVAWSFRSFDGGKKSKESIIKNIKNQIKGGEILLFHDNRKQTIEILEEVLPWLQHNYNLNSNLENAV